MKDNKCECGRVTKVYNDTTAYWCMGCGNPCKVANKATTKRSRDPETLEYRVRLFINGVYQPGADHFTDDLEDAIGTAAAMEKGAGYSDKETPEAIEELAAYEQEQQSGDLCHA